MSDRICKDCGLSKPEAEFRKWSRQCKECYKSYMQVRYNNQVRPHTAKAQRNTAPLKATAERKADYAAIMRERLGFELRGCEWGGDATGEPYQRCPLWNECHELDTAGQDLFCELSWDEAGVVEIKASGMPEPEAGREDMIFWMDVTMSSHVKANKAIVFD